MSELEERPAPAGCELHVRSRLEQAGLPVLLVHGLGSSAAETWEVSGWWRALDAAGLGWIAPDLRGHGASPKPHDPGSYRLPLLAADLVAVMDRLGVATVDLVGYSLGARVALELAGAAPSRVRRLVLGGLGSARGASPEAFAAVLKQLPPTADRAAAEACLTGAAGSATADPGSVRVPTLLVAGGDDSLATGVETLGSAFPDARVLRVAGRNHLNAVSSQQFKRAVIEFFQASPSSA